MPIARLRICGGDFGAGQSSTTLRTNSRGFLRNVGELWRKIGDGIRCDELDLCGNCLILNCQILILLFTDAFHVPSGSADPDSVEA
jgi:hypothetical protein